MELCRRCVKHPNMREQDKGQPQGSVLFEGAGIWAPRNAAIMGLVLKRYETRRFCVTNWDINAAPFYGGIQAPVEDRGLAPYIAVTPGVERRLSSNQSLLPEEGLA